MKAAVFLVTTALSWALVACTAAAPTQVSVPAKASAYEDAAPDSATEPQPGTKEAPKPVAEPREQTFVVELDVPHTTEDGLEVTVKAEGHAHEENGGTTSFFKIVFTKGDATKEYSYSFYDALPFWYLEGRTMGYDFQVESLFDRDDERKALTDPEDIAKNKKRKVTLVPTDEPELTEEEEHERGRALADKVLANRGCKGDTRAGSAEGPGVYGLSVINGRKLVCTVTVTAYSKQVLKFKRHKRKKK